MVIWFYCYMAEMYKIKDYGKNFSKMVKLLNC